MGSDLASVLRYENLLPRSLAQKLVCWRSKRCVLYGRYQLSHAGDESFIQDLASVWNSVAKRCLPNARLVCGLVRFQAPRKIHASFSARSLALADCGWTVTTIKNAGSATRGKRQSDQFSEGRSTPIDEIDLYAVLKK